MTSLAAESLSLSESFSLYLTRRTDEFLRKLRLEGAALFCCEVSLVLREALALVLLLLERAELALAERVVRKVTVGRCVGQAALRRV